MKKYCLLIFLFFTYFFQAQIINIPDANFKAKLLSASSDNPVASNQIPENYYGSVSTYNTIDTNNDGEIQVSEALMIKYLNVDGSNVSNLQGINSFSNLVTLSCNNNQITSLSSIMGITNLKFLACYNNQITSLNVSSLINLRWLDCFNNQISSLNVSGLINLSTIRCFENQLSTLNVNGLTNLETLYCGDNQLVNLNVSGLLNLKYLDCKNNQLSTLNVNGSTNIINLYCENNQLTTLDVSGLFNLISFICSNNNLSSLNVAGTINLESLSCNNNQLSNLNLSGLTSLLFLACNNNLLSSIDLDGLINLSGLNCSFNQLNSLFINNNNFTIYSNLIFSNNLNLQYICTNEILISYIQDKINQYGYAGTCHVNSYCSFTPGGTNYTIQGSNKFDGNSNGCDASDGFYPNLKYSITDGTNSGSLISNTSGNYSIPVSAGTHTITPQFENPTYFTSSPTSTTVGFPATASPFTQDFCIVPNGVRHDLEVVIIPLDPARPGFDASYKIKYKNKGTVSETATLVFNYSDSVLDYVSSTLAPTSTGIGLLSWNIGTVIPFQSGEFVVTLNINSPMETPAVNGGDILSYTATINGLNTDETQLDNTFPLRQIVVNSYDPNDKTCLEGTTLNPTMIGEYVHYQIRFENTGTFPAQNVVIKDMIDTTKFDISTLQITDTSHSCVTRITNPDKVEFIFENINLPFDDATNDGYVVFKIKTKPTLTVGSTISNLANIYFDYNFPIVTNTATSTFQALANNQFSLNNYISLSPNPAKDVLNINVQDEVNIKSIAIYNMLGQLVQITTSPTNSLNVSDLKAGNYIIKLYSEEGEIRGKFIKE
jgi:Leucine-rich repeat (LRR) protein